MIIEIKVPKRVTKSIYWPNEVAREKRDSFFRFVSMMTNRLIVGTFRYDKGKPIVAAKFLTRLEAELDAYKESGNVEHLVNVANYAFLETVAPERTFNFFAHLTKSVTRDTKGMML